MTTLTYGFKRPDTGDLGSVWFPAMEDNITRLDAHDHDGTDSAQLTNAGIHASAAIARTKLASGTAYRILANTSAGVMSENAALTAAHVVYADANGQLAGEAALSITRGGTGQATANPAFNALAPTTTKGDLIAYSTVNARLGVGANGTVLTADSAETTGVKWAAPTAAALESTKLTNLSLALSAGAGALTIALKTQDGGDPAAGDPIKVGFRNVTAATCNFTEVSIEAAQSLVVNSTATLGFLSGATHYAYVYLLNNAGTAELAIAGVLFDEGSVRSSTTIGTGSDSIGVLYSTTGRSNVPIRLIARLKFTLTTAGTWDEVGDECAILPFDLEETVSAKYNNSGQTLEVAGSGEIIGWDVRLKDSHNGMNTSTGEYTVRKAGRYAVHASVAHQDAAWTAGNISLLNIRKDAAPVAVDQFEAQASVTLIVHQHVYDEIDCVVGTVIDIFLDHDRTGGNTSLLTTDLYTHVEITRLGP